MEESIVSGPFIVLDPSTYTECGDLSSGVGQGRQLLHAPHQNQHLTVLRGDGAPSSSDTLLTWKCVDGILLCLPGHTSDSPGLVTETFTSNEQHHVYNPPPPADCLQQPPAASVSQSEGGVAHGHISVYREDTTTYVLDDPLPGPHTEHVTSTTATITTSSSRSGMVLRSVCNKEAVSPHSPREGSPEGVRGAVSAPGPSTIPGLSSCSLEVRLACRDALMPARRIRRTVVPARGGQGCPVCGRRFVSVLKMKKHVGLCRGGSRREPSSKAPPDELAEKHACDLCEAVFPRPLLLQDHMSYIHNLERPFSCMHCPKKFYRSHDLKIHLNIHYNIKNYVCDVCGRQFNHLSNLKRHQRLHTGVCPYVCEICEQRFSQIVGLRQHVALHEKNSRTPINTRRKKRKSYCQACGKTFDRKSDRDLHEKREHSEGTFECKSCVNSFSTLDLLKSHSCSRHRLRRRRKILRKNNNHQISKLNAWKNTKNTPTENKSRDRRNISLESTETIDCSDKRSNETVANKGFQVGEAKSLVQSSSVLEALPKATPQNSDTLVMYLTQGGDSMAYVLKKKEETVKASVLDAPGHPPAITSYRATDETILINVEEQQLSSCAGRGAPSPAPSALPGHFGVAPQASVSYTSSEQSAVPGGSGAVVATAASEAEGITIKEEDIELEFDSDGEAIHNPEHISFCNDVCIHTIVSDITHELAVHDSDFVSSESFASSVTATRAPAAAKRRGRPPKSALKFVGTSDKKYDGPNSVHKVVTDQDSSSSRGRVTHVQTNRHTKTEKPPTKTIVFQRGTKTNTEVKNFESVVKNVSGTAGTEPEEPRSVEAEQGRGQAGKKELCCPECGKTFNRRWNYDQHYSLHFPSLNRYQCGLCSKTFAYRTTYTAHCASAHGDRQVQYSCSQCNKTLGSSGALRAHERRVHQKLKPHACHLCSRTFHVKSELSYHLRLHRREQPYVCYACGRTFSHSSHLHRHERQHTGDRPHRCQLCPQTFIQAIGLSTHLKKHHRQQPPLKQHLRPKPHPDAALVQPRPPGSSQAHTVATGSAHNASVAAYSGDNTVSMVYNPAQKGVTGQSGDNTVSVVYNPDQKGVVMPTGHSGDNTVSVVYNPTQKGTMMPILEPEGAIKMEHIYQELELHAPPLDSVAVAGATTSSRLPAQAVGGCLVFGEGAPSPTVPSRGRAAPHGSLTASIGEGRAAVEGRGRGATVTVLNPGDIVPVISIADTADSVPHQDSGMFMPSLTGEGPSGGQGAPASGQAVPNIVNVNDVYNIILWRN